MSQRNIIHCKIYVYMYVYSIVAITDVLGILDPKNGGEKNQPYFQTLGKMGSHDFAILSVIIKWLPVITMATMKDV